MSALDRAFPDMSEVYSRELQELAIAEGAGTGH